MSAFFSIDKQTPDSTHSERKTHVKMKSIGYLHYRKDEREITQFQADAILIVSDVLSSKKYGLNQIASESLSKFHKRRRNT